MKNRKTFDLEAELQKAWDFAWEYYCKPTVWDGRTIEPRQQWLTATDLENRVRAAGNEAMHGDPYGSCGMNTYGSGVIVKTGTGMPLLDVCRRWLADQVRAGRFVAHNFGRGHCSGMRFRPVGVELTAGEQKTLAAKEKRAKGETPVHFRSQGGNFFTSRPICVGERKKATATFRRPARSKAAMTSDREKVTCQRCLKLLAEKAVEAQS